jgi:FMN-dependent NADH-azoreductase
MTMAAVAVAVAVESWPSRNGEAWLFDQGHHLPRLPLMLNILHITCSPNGHAAESHRLGRKIIDTVAHGARVTVLERDVGNGSLGHIDADYARAQQSPSAEPMPQGAAAQSDLLIGEVEAADVVVLSTPMHNLMVPSGLKAWIDHVVRARRTFALTPQGKQPLLRDRPVYIAIASGGVFSGPDARQPDFLTPYLRTVLAQVGLLDLSFLSVQGTARGPEALAATRARTDEDIQAHFRLQSA